LIEEPQFKNLIADYNKLLGESVSEGHERFHEFMPIFESLMGLHRSKRFTKQLPDKVRVTYLSMMNDQEFMKKNLSLRQLSYLLYANASPGLLSISIKVTQTFSFSLDTDNLRSFAS
jgi:hypothetical protein